MDFPLSVLWQNNRARGRKVPGAHCTKPRSVKSVIWAQSPICWNGRQFMTILQVGALPLRKSRGGFEVLLISSRETGRWVIPKGWPSKRLSDPNAAAREAKQEAGVTGKI